MINKETGELNTNIPAENAIGVYMIHAPNFEKAYFGSSNEVRRRLLRHRRDLVNRDHDNWELQQLFNKWGHLLQICIYYTDTKEEALNIEQAFIDEWFGTTAICNLAQDARSSGIGYIPKPETIERIRQANIGKPKSEAHRASISRTLMGRPVQPHVAEMLRSMNKGKIFSDETRKKMSLSGKGKVFSLETRQRMSEAVKRKPPVTMETRLKLSLARKGKPAIRTEKGLEALRLARIKPVSVEGTHYESIKLAAETLGLTIKVISNRLNSNNYPTYKRL